MKNVIKKQHKPRMKWQTGAYERWADFRFVLPYQLLLLCKLLEITPEEIVWDFLYNLDCSNRDRAKRAKAREHLMNYFIECGYGQQCYTEDNIRQMFSEMDAVNQLFPENSDNEDLLKKYCEWRDEHQSWWFKKWYYKIRRKKVKGED